MVTETLKRIGADGLCDDFGCGCTLKDLMPCGEPCYTTCVAATNNTDRADEEGAIFWMEPWDGTQMEVRG